MKPAFSFLPELLKVTRSAALACFEHIGSGERESADRSAVNAMRKAFQTVPIKGQVVIGEGERDSAPMLYIGEKVGMYGESHPEWDIAVDPLEGTNLCAKALEGAWSVLAMTEKGGLFKAPDIYMQKIACGPPAKGVIDLDLSVEENIKRVSKALNKKNREMTVAVLDRPRHKTLIKSLYSLGARVRLIEDGDLSASILTGWNKSEESIDLMMGTGGAPEGVLSACALKCLGGDFQGRLVFQNEEEKKRAEKMGAENKIYKLEELVKAPVVFCATGVTSGPLLNGIKKTAKRVETESLYISSLMKESLKIQATHFAP